jgi:hypothetical protein
MPQEPAKEAKGEDAFCGELSCDESTIEKFRRLIDNEDYLNQAIHRIAQIISNELVHDSAGQGGQ